MTIELLAALVVIALGLVQVFLQASEFRRVHGVVYANTAQDTAPTQPDSVLLGRLTRALRNLHETLPFFLGVVIILALMGHSTQMTQISALVFAGARIIYVPLYAFGVPNLRGLVWTISFVALIVLVSAALRAADWSALSAIG
ncbi:MAG: MAPEG family protein [Hyphomonas sp.]